MIVGWISRKHFDSGRGGIFFLTSLLIELIDRDFGEQTAQAGEIADFNNYHYGDPFMRKNSKITIWLGLCGLLIGAALYVYSSLFDYTKPLTASDAVVGLMCFVLCPPSLLFVLCIDCEVGGVSGAIAFLLIALMNAGLYSMIAFLVLRLRKSRTGFLV
jgi:hypothetical protein